MLLLSLMGPAHGDDAASKPTKPAPPLEQRPYAIRAWLSIDPRARVGPRGRDLLVSSWRTLARRFVGPAWELDVADGPGPLAVADLDSLTAEQVAPAIDGRDKGWLIRIEPEGPGYRLRAREFDAATGLLGPVHSRPAPHPADAARDLLGLALQTFGPSGEVGEASADNVRVRLQAGALAPPDPSGRLARPGTVFRVGRVYQKPDGTRIKLELVRATYLRVVQVDGAEARCQIVSAISNPLTRQVVQRSRLLAVGVQPAPVPTRLRFVLATPERPPLAGYTLTARPATMASARVVGLTDRAGRVTLPPEPADGLVILRLLAANIEPVIEFPIMPGERDDELTLVVPDDRSAAVAFETEVSALRDEVVDLIARRARIEARLKSRAEGEVWDEVGQLLVEARKLTGREAMQGRLQQLEDDARKRQTRRSPVLTGSAQALLTEARSLIERYLDDDAFNAYAEALKQAEAEQAKMAGTAKSAAGKAAGRPGAARDDEERLQGTWRLVALEVDGRQAPPPAGEAMPTQTFRDGTFTYSAPGGIRASGKYELDPRARPPAIDLRYDGQAQPGLAVYELKGDRLTICAAPPGGDRPASLATRPGSNLSLYTYDRVLASSAPPATPAPAPAASPPPRAEAPKAAPAAPAPAPKPAGKPARGPTPVGSTPF